MSIPSAIGGPFSEETRRRGARDRRGLRGEGRRRGQGYRAKRCGYTHILSSETSIAKEHVGTGVGETGGKRLADAEYRYEFIPIKPLAATDSSAPGSCAGHSRAPSPDRGH